MKKFLLFTLFAGTILNFCGCASAPEKKTVRPRLTLGVPHGKVKYTPVKHDGLELKVFGRNEFQAGRPASVTFALSNNGVKKVSIPEWYSNEPDNIGLFVQPTQPGVFEPDERKWVQLTFDFKEPIMHYPITLFPGNQALVSKNLDFVEKMMIPAGEERYFFLRAELTLESLSLSTKTVLIKVTSNVKR